MVLAILYVTLPWWLPKQYLAGRIATMLSRQLGLPVKIGRLGLSWREGLTIDGLEIASADEFGGGEMVVLGSLRCEFSPIRLLLEERVRWAEVNDLQFRIVINEDGQVNLAALERLKLGYPPEHLMVRRGRVTVQLPRHDRLLRLSVADLQYRWGRLKSIGRITMSAVLQQSGRAAPVTLLASAGGAGGSNSAAGPSGMIAAACSFRFADVDISQLNLPLLLGLPLKRLDGRGSGRLDCRVSQSGVVDEFSFVLGIDNLGAEPRSGPALPVIEQAEVSLAAAYDPLTQRADIHTLRLRLPGIDLLGEGSMHADVLSGRWEGIRSLDVTGAINPCTVAALLSGKLPGGLVLDGDVGVRVKLRGDLAQLSAEVMLDATAALMHAGERVVKPAGRRLVAELNGSLEKRTWQFTADKAELRIGGNHFRGSGAVQKARQLLREIVSASGAASVGALLTRLTELDWHGYWEITELASLRDLLGGGLLDEAELQGQILGQWFVEPGGLIGFRSVRIPVGARLSLGGWLVKRPDQPMRMELSALIQVDRPGLGRIRASAEIGPARASIDDATLSFLTGQEDLTIRAEGNYTLRGTGELLACIPAAEKWKGQVDGAVRGNFVGILAPSFRRLHLQANATQLDLAPAAAFRKEAGQPAEVVMDFQSHDGLEVPYRNRISLQAKLSAARLDGSLYFPPAGAAEAGVRCWARVSVSDADWLLGRLPAARSILGDWNIRGSTTATLRLRLGERLVDGEMTWEADDLQFELPNGGGSKARGTALRVRLAGQITERAAVISALAAELGRSSLFLRGRVALAGDNAAPAGRKWWPPPGVAGAELFARGRFAPDPAARALFPWLDEHATRHGLQGALRAEAVIRADRDAVHLAAKLDADALAIASGRWFGKPAGAKARGRLELTLPADLARVHVRDAFLDGGAFQLRADMVWPVLSDGPAEAHVALNVPDLRRLADHVPILSPYNPTGAAFLEGELQRRAGQDSIKYVTLSAGNVAITYGGRRCRADGKVTLERLLRAGGQITLGRAFTDSLELALGKSRLFLAADLRDPTTSPGGRVELLAENLDMHDLGGLSGAPAPPASRLPLTPAETKDLTERADEFIAAAARLLGSAGVRCRLQADRLVYLDPIVRAFYEVRSLTADAEAEKGLVRLGLRCGLNGGHVDQSFEVSLKGPTKVVRVRSRFREIMSGENMIAQLAREFPGNTFYGAFSRTEDLSYGLRDLVMQALDPRHRPVAVGVATTITEDGRVQGRAAPKFITRFFPGLNLATYRYRRMTGFAEFLPDGSAHNDMIFEGVNYDLYMEGITDHDRIGRYEIGAIVPRLLESPASNRRLHQGRVPILKFKARIEGGTFHDEEVSYPLPPETAYVIFVRNNIVYRLLAGGRRQRTSEVIREPTTAPGGGGNAGK